MSTASMSITLKNNHGELETHTYAFADLDKWEFKRDGGTVRLNVGVSEVVEIGVTPVESKEKIYLPDSYINATKGMFVQYPTVTGINGNEVDINAVAAPILVEKVDNNDPEATFAEAMRGCRYYIEVPSHDASAIRSMLGAFR